MKLLRLALLAFPLLAGCFVNVKIPLDTDLDRTRLGDKVGESSAQSVLWLFFWGDAGTPLELPTDTRCSSRSRPHPK